MIRAFALTGPTASGKTALSLALAEEIGAEIISCDSMQIYRKMDIGTAKATKAERERIPHHLIDIVDAGVSFSAQDYAVLALNTAKEIVSRKKVPLFVGGTGLYLDTLERIPAEEIPKSDPSFRDRLLRDYPGEEGAIRLYERLCAIDPQSAAATHPNNRRRVIRALEIYECTGRTKTELDRLSRQSSPDISITKITLDFHKRETLYRRIDQRVDEMLRMGLLSEVESLFREGALAKDTTAHQAIGYKELFQYLMGECTLSDAIQNLKTASRHYAKRQLTWFRHAGVAHTLYIDDENGDIRSEADLMRELIDFAKNPPAF